MNVNLSSSTKISVNFSFYYSTVDFKIKFLAETESEQFKIFLEEKKNQLIAHFIFILSWILFFMENRSNS